jgi:hypothetical protein
MHESYPGIYGLRCDGCGLVVRHGAGGEDAGKGDEMREAACFVVQLLSRTGRNMCEGGREA